jgi:hypothetical protein
MRAFDEYWMEHYHRIITDEGTMIYSGDLMISKIDQIYDPSRDEVVASSMPLEVSLSSKLILEDSVDVLIIRKESGANGKTTLRGINLEDPHPADNGRYVHLKAGLFRIAIQRYLGGHANKRHYLYEYWPLEGTKKIIDPKPFDIPTLFELSYKVSVAIQKKIFYPTMSKEICKACPHKKTCNLTLIRK